jgi:hypothetical protein
MIAGTGEVATVGGTWSSGDVELVNQISQRCEGHPGDTHVAGTGLAG